MTKLNNSTAIDESIIQQQYKQMHSWLKVLTLVTAFLVPLFLILDYFTCPKELFGRFALYRFIATGIVIGIQITLRVTKPSKFSMIYGYMISIVVGLAIILMTRDLGGFDSSYYAGLNLVIIAINLFIPWKPINSLFSSIIVVVMYISINFASGLNFNINNLINNLYFMSSSIFITIIASYLRYNQAQKEFILRNELEHAQIGEIKELATAAEVIASGDLTIKIEKKSDDIAGILEVSFNIMINNMRDALSQIINVSQSLSDYGNAIEKNTDHIAQGANKQLEVTSESVDVINSMTGKIIENAQKATDTNAMADKAIETADQSSIYVNAAVEGMNKIASVVKESAKKVLSLSQSSERINEIVQVINDIADQTNLLALNAAIEAARAGDHGKGFAIVAEEVGKLSEKTSGATKEITDMIKNVISDIEITVKSIDTANSEVDVAINHVKQMHQSMEEIISISKNLQEMMRLLTLDNDSQAEAAGKINTHIESINNISNQLTDSVDGIIETANGMNTLTSLLEMTVNRFKV